MFEDVKVVIMMREAALILSGAEIQNMLERWSWVLDFMLSELRGDSWRTCGTSGRKRIL